MQKDDVSSTPPSAKDRVEILRTRVAASEIRAHDAAARLRYIQAEVKLAELTPKLEALRRKTTA
jgi:hypothetical protein